MKKLILIGWVFMSLVACAKGENGDDAAPAAAEVQTKKENKCDSGYVQLLIFQSGNYRVTLYDNGVYEFEGTLKNRGESEGKQSGFYQELQNDLSSVRIYKLGIKTLLVYGFQAHLSGVWMPSELSLVYAGDLELTEDNRKVICASAPQAVP